MTTYDRIARRTLQYLLSLSVLIFSSATTPTSASPQHCSNVPSIGLDETLRGESLQAGEPDCYRVRTPATGLLMFDLAVPGTTTAEPRLGLLGAYCERPPRVDVIERSASHLLVLSDAQELTVCAGAQDPHAELGEYKLRATFLELNDAGIQKAEQAEVEPDPFIGCQQKAEQAEVEPDPFTGALCRNQDLDDHSDHRMCATAIELGRNIAGEIDNGWGDDHDVFVFELTAAQTVRVESSGAVDTFGGLYDRRGQRLAAAGDGGQDANFRLVKTLLPGVYFVRIEGAPWSEGAYALEIGTVEHSW